MNPTSKKKIAVIGLKGLPAYGGAATVGENIIEKLKDKYDFTVYSVSTHTSLKTGFYDGFEQIVFNQRKKNGFNTLKYYLKSMFHCLFFKNYDLIHLHHNAVSFLIPFLKIRYKVILTTHGLVTEEKFSYLQYLYKISDWIFLRFSNIITTVSKTDFRIAIKLKKNNVFYIPNGINILQDTYPLYINENNYILFAAGRIFKSKGCHIMLEALIHQNYKGRILIAGDLEQAPEYKNQILKHAEKLPNIEFLGLIKKKDELFSLIKNAKLFVYPSNMEAMSIMMLEVCSLFTPIICSDCTFNKDIFSNDEVLFAKQNDILDWSIKIKWALDNYSIMEIKAQKAFELLKNNYLWSDISKKYDECYMKCF